MGLGCIYFIGLYLLLRILLRDAVGAATGTLVAVYLQCFTGNLGKPLWVWPSSSVLRYVLDVWFFLALCLHARTRKMAWIAACGVVSGLC